MSSSLHLNGPDNVSRVAVWRAESRSITEIALGTAVEMPDVVAALRARRATQPDASALVVLVVKPEGSGLRVQGHLAFCERAPAAIVLGAHPRCDLPDLPGACLRHAALVGWRTGEIEALDLATGVAFSVNGVRSVRASATRAMRMTLGECDVFALHVPAHQDLQLGWNAVERALRGAGVGDNVPLTHEGRVQVRSVRDMEAARELSRRYENTVVTREGAARRSTSSSRTITVDSSIAELARGVLIGRYPRCQVRGPLGDVPSVSRVHALVLARDGLIYVADVCSTNGTTVRANDGSARAELYDSQRMHLLCTDEVIELQGYVVRLVVAD